ncbi:hypothetical protein [Streptomyces sp. NPDC006267]|uniref:hypothetical protein n=1 Tax=unclassified Streptomyces TaxID=2593676 RepID=UPI0033B78C6E
MSSRLWPLIAARMRSMDIDQAMNLSPYLALIAPDTAAWRTGPPTETTKRLVIATHHALTTPLDQPLPAGPRVSTTAARSRSTTTAPDTAPPKHPTPAEPATPAHRQQNVPTRREGFERSDQAGQ